MENSEIIITNKKELFHVYDNDHEYSDKKMNEKDLSQTLISNFSHEINNALNDYTFSEHTDDDNNKY